MRVLRPCLPGLFAFAALMAVLFTRDWGVNIDENQYLAYSAFLPLGDVPSSGKPLLFYLVNYLFYHGPGWFLGPLQQVSPGIFYAAAIAFSLGWLARELSENDREFRWLFALVLLTPFTVFNSSEFMMEAPLVALTNVAFAALARMERRGITRMWHAILFLSVFTATLLKVTEIPAILALACGVRRQRKPKLWNMALAVSLAFPVNYMILEIIGAPHEYYDPYGGPANLVNLAHLRKKLPAMPDNLWTWFFLVGVPLLLAVGALIYKGRGQAKESWRRFLVMAAGSLAGCVAIDLATPFDMPRYMYPAIWVALVSLSVIVSRGSKWIAAAVIALSLFPIATLWGAFGVERFALWPGYVARDVYFSGYVILPGVPIFRWLAGSKDKRANLCVYLPLASSEHPGVVAQFLRAMTQSPRFFDETNVAAFEKCDGPKAIVRRQFQTQPEVCPPGCDEKTFQAIGCVVQPMLNSSTHIGLAVTNRTCLP